MTIRVLELQIDRASDRVSELESTEKAPIEAKSLSKEIKRARDAVQSNKEGITRPQSLGKESAITAAKKEESDAPKAMNRVIVPMDRIVLMERHPKRYHVS